MLRRNQTLLIVFLIICVSILLLCRKSYADSPKIVEIVFSPPISEIPVRSNPIALKAFVIGESPLFYEWRLNGPGKFEGPIDGSAVVYIPPEQIDGRSAEAIILVRVRDKMGQVATESVTFNIIPTLSPIPTPTPTPTPKPAAIRTLTKTAIGVGAVAALGVGTCFLLLSNDEYNNGSDKPYVRINFPSYGSQVNRLVDIYGIAEGFKSGDYVSIVVYSYADNQSYPQTNIGIPDENGNWTVLGCYFGREGDIDVGVDYEIQAYLKDANHEAKATDAVKVTRK